MPMMALAAAAAAAALAASLAALLRVFLGGDFFSTSFFFGSGSWVAVFVVDDFDAQFAQPLMQAPVDGVFVGSTGGDSSAGFRLITPLPGGGS